MSDSLFSMPASLFDKICAMKDGDMWLYLYKRNCLCGVGEIAHDLQYSEARAQDILHKLCAIGVVECVYVADYHMYGVNRSSFTLSN